MNLLCSHCYVANTSHLFHRMATQPTMERYSLFRWKGLLNSSAELLIRVWPKFSEFIRSWPYGQSVGLWTSINSTFLAGGFLLLPMKAHT